MASSESRASGKSKKMQLYVECFSQQSNGDQRTFLSIETSYWESECLGPKSTLFQPGPILYDSLSVSFKIKPIFKNQYYKHIVILYNLYNYLPVFLEKLFMVNSEKIDW